VGKPEGGPPITIAHRAGNSLTKLEAAFAAGIEYVEADVWWRRRRLEVRHDKSAGPIPFLWDRWSIRPDGRALVLGEVFGAVAGRGKVFLDLKGTATDLAEAIAAEAARLGAADSIAASGNWPHLDRLSNLLPGMPLFYSVGSVGRLDSLQPRLERESVSGISIDRDIVDPSVIAHLRAHGVRSIVTWHVETFDRAREVLDWGVDGITSSNIELLAAIRRGELRKPEVRTGMPADASPARADESGSPGRAQ
jgi:glycerophosphoryl diester phosphodiesterase